MVTRRVSEDFNGFLANASGYQNTQFQKLICPDGAEGLSQTDEICYNGAANR